MNPRLAAASLLALAAWAVPAASTARAQLHSALEKKGLEGLTAVPLALIPDVRLSPLGTTALAIRPADWKHAVTGNFVFHYFESHVASPVAVEAEFHTRVLWRELRLESVPPGGRAHVFVFDRPADWQQFQKHGRLDPWTGGIHAGNEVFVLRNAAYKFKGNALGHEIVHLTLFRAFGGRLPLWVEEGLAEFLSTRTHAAYQRARGYDARPFVPALPVDAHIDLRSLFANARYPTDPAVVDLFYAQSHVLVRLLWGDDPSRFLEFLAKLGRGESAEAALASSFGGTYSTPEDLERVLLSKYRRTGPAP
jgi:hypothetical protein